MSEKPKNFNKAIDELERGAESMGSDFKAHLKEELKGVEDTIRKLKPQLDELRHKVSDEVKKTKGSVEEQVKENPWAAIGIVGLIFFVLGFLLGHKGRSRD